MTNLISFLFDWLLGLTRPGADPNDVRAFVANPTQAASQAMGTAVTQAQLMQAASAVVAPGAVYGSNPVQALQHTVADNHGLTFAPQRVFAPETNTDLASHNDIGSPRAGEDVQQGVGNVERQLNILGQVTDHANKLAPGAPEATPQPVGST